MTSSSTEAVEQLIDFGVGLMLCGDGVRRANMR